MSRHLSGAPDFHPLWGRVTGTEVGRALREDARIKRAWCQVQGRWTQLGRRRLLCLGGRPPLVTGFLNMSRALPGVPGVPHPDGAICEDLPEAICELGASLARVGATEGAGLRRNLTRVL